MNFKLALAAAAVVGLAGTAQAADLAKKAPAAADYVKVCDAYGAGFFYIPGSDTCLKIGGYVRVELRTGDHDTNGAAPGVGLGYDRGENYLNSRVRTQLTFDARTNTEMGLLRSFIELWIQNQSGQTGTVSVNMRNAFVQFAGLTAGRASSNFDFIQGGYNIGNIEQDGSDRRVNLLAYTFSFGNGISATLGIEDPTTADAALPWGWVPARNAAGAIVGIAYDGSTNVRMPDFVGNIAIAQSWGRAQLSAAIHANRNDVFYVTAQEKTGYVIGAGVEVNLPMLGAGDKMFVQGAYTKGAVDYLLNSTNTGFGVLARNWDSATETNSKAWFVAGGLNHNFSKAVEANLGVSYFDYEDATIAANDYTSWVIGGDVRWKPVAGLTLAAALDYRTIDYNARGVSNGDQWMGTLRVQRNF
ncbi:porin [Pinisolibacter sp.]|uniref:porin n=1 Tax=Pinisolibacter sp. TaxID=2172024 RepID=UPI002FDDE8B4